MPKPEQSPEMAAIAPESRMKPDAELTFKVIR
jgi:hypothetical protein